LKKEYAGDKQKKDPCGQPLPW